MNKISLINNKTEESHDNKVKKKSKFKKFLSSSMAVMVLSVGLAAPMTLRADDTDKKEIKTVQDANERLVDGMKKIKKKAEKKLEEVREEIKEIDKKIEQNNKEIEESKKREMEAKKQEMEARKQIEENNRKFCSKLETIIPAMKNYCSKNKCSEEQNKKMSEAQKDYKERCEKLVTKRE
jgi:TolA-binding protein